MRRALTVALAAFLAAGCAGPRLRLGSTAQGEVVEAEGVVLHDPADPLGTRKKALLEAQKSAVEKVVGLYLSARTRVEKALLVDQNILARTEGYLKKYDVLSEREEGGFFKTRIRALVAFGEIGKDLDALGLLKSPAVGNPRVALEIEEKLDGARVDGRFAAEAFSAALLEAGYRVVEGGGPEAAEVVIRGEAEALPFQTEGLGGFVSDRATISVRAVRAGTDQVVMTLSHEASALGGSAELAGRKALETAGRLAGGEATRRLARELSRRSGVMVSVEGLPDAAALETFEKSLRAAPGVTDLFLRNYSEGLALIELETKGAGAGDVARHLSSDPAVGVKMIRSDSLVLEWKK